MELAEKANISTNFVSGIERGLQWPYPETLQNLATALDVKVYELFKPENEVSPSIEQSMDRFANDVIIAVQESTKKALRNVKRQYMGKED
jgi:transcriptional regulator with XRE-family HTH domain